ncbi:MAG TPA: DUF997 family protein [Pirellulaceae bacterium]|nr:DUF997 family protein [Pirellulaceae bacterium]
MTARREDPVLTSSRREAILVLLIWLVACTYSIGVCYAWGYGRDAATLTYIFGFPDWVFWGVIVPWSVCTLLALILGSFVVTDDDLGEEQAEVDLSPAPQEADRA